VRTQRLHPLLAAFFATVAGSFLGAFMLAAAGITGKSAGWAQVSGATVAIGIYSVLVGFPSVLAYGMPVFALLRRLGFANTTTAIVFGALPGLIWVLWTRGSWLDPILWNGTLIAFFYVLLRRVQVAV
jgi:hypothetical protein